MFGFLNLLPVCLYHHARSKLRAISKKKNQKPPSISKDPKKATKKWTEYKRKQKTKIRGTEKEKLSLSVSDNAPFNAVVVEGRELPTRLNYIRIA